MKNLNKCLLYVFITSILYAAFLAGIYKVFPSLDNSIYVKPLLAAFYMWIPGSFALFYSRKENLKFKWLERPTKWWLISLAIPLIIVVSTTFVGFGLTISSITFPSLEGNIFNSFSSSYSVNLSAFLLFTILTGALSAVTINYIFALGEELLWRGYLWEKLKCLGFWRASFSIGFIWGLWHVPIIAFLGHNYGTNRLIGSILFVGLCAILSPIMILLRQRSNSLMSVSIFHGMYNAIAAFPIIFYKSPNLLVVSGVGVSALFSIIILNLFIYKYYKKLLKAEIVRFN